MRLTAIGTGTASPTADAVNAGWLVAAGDVRLLLDCGSGVVHRMATLGMDWRTITHVAITHFHADHISDLATLITAWRYGDLPPRSAPVEIIGPPGTLGMLGRTAALFGEWMLEPGFPLTVHEVADNQPLPLGADMTISARPVPHSTESVAYLVARGARRIVYTGDTGPDDTLGAWAAGCDVLVAECSLPRAMAVPAHLTPEDCAALAAAARPGTLVLTHRYPALATVDIAAIIRTRYTGPVVLATDGWTIELED